MATSFVLLFIVILIPFGLYFYIVIVVLLNFDNDCCVTLHGLPGLSSGIQLAHENTPANISPIYTRYPSMLQLGGLLPQLIPGHQVSILGRL